MKLNQTVAYSFIIAVLLAVPVNLFPRVYMFEIVAVFATMWLFLRDKNATKLILAFFCVAIVAAISTLQNQTPASSLFSREANFSLALCDGLLVFTLLRQTHLSNWPRYIVVMSLGIIVTLIYPEDLRALDEPMKFLVGVPLGALVAYFTGGGRFSSGIRSVIVLFAATLFGGFCFYVGARNLGGTFLFASILWVVFAGYGVTARKTGRYRSGTSTLLFILGLAVLGIGLLQGYGMAARTGVFGERAADIANAQTESAGNLLLGGRPEIIANLAAFIDAPILGHGVGAEGEKYRRLLLESGYWDETYYILDEGLPLHSVIFGAAAETGILALLFWTWMLWVLLQAVLAVNILRPKHGLVLSFVLLSACWDVLFSPLTGVSRIKFAMALGIALAILSSFNAAWANPRSIKNGFGTGGWGWYGVPMRRRNFPRDS